MQSQYTQDVEFNSGFGALQTPVHMYTAATLCGFAAPAIDRPFRFLDLACGNGLTLALLADAYPRSEFVGIDINASHVARARSRAKKAELGNLRIEEGDLLELADRDLGEFDYCAVGGVYSWLDASRTAATRWLLASVLRPGGVLYLDYCSQPGMAQTAPLYQLLTRLGNTVSGTSAERLTCAVRMAETLRRDDAQFFRSNPNAAARLESIRRNPAEDEAHEVFNLQGSGFWSGDVIQSLDEAGFDFVGSSGLHHNFPLLTGRPDALKSAQGMPVAVQQTIFDVAWNVGQRRDIYVRRGAATKLDFESALRDLSLYAMPGALTPGNRRKLAKIFRHFDFCAPEADEFARIASGAATFGSLFEGMSARGMSIDATMAMTKHFIASRLISIAAQPPISSSEAGDLELKSRLNRIILVEDIGNEHARPFSSSVVGSRVMLPLKDRLYLWRLLSMDLVQAWDSLGELRGLFRDPNNQPLTLNAFVATIDESLPTFRRLAGAELLRLGILQRAGQG